ncbi:serine/threonine-protein kinase [Streptomyces sp. NBS 14/10]|uniref:serine/threonine-protein kinase n=1 Tax=Streptomyces sp. NBS 14/10 TaxID=1945643 RepID=UPI001C530832|nr:serine/threonine-protein kinase [Streptomyces sp. NBS 14/10]KAK1181530.1 serine/threonine-protein kinase [Streptomyces sp. NBS 14/10]
MASETGVGRLVTGRYRLIGELGSGGFGRVWKARDERLRVDVALKEVTLSQAGSGAERTERVNRAIHEARNAARLRTHPNIVAVHDVVREDDVPWIVMELVTGGTLEEEIRERGRVPAAEVRRIAEAVLGALRAAHAAGIVHRDVKPSNVMLADDGRVLLADFGIAVHDADTALTATGGVIGSLEYIAPERIGHGDDSPAGDLFSLGVTLYHAVEGVSPFHRATPTASVAAVMAHEPDPPKHAGELAGLLTRLLDKAPATRVTVSEALAMLDTGPTVPGPTVPVLERPTAVTSPAGAPGRAALRGAVAAVWAGRSRRWRLATAGVAGMAILLAVVLAVTIGTSGDRTGTSRKPRLYEKGEVALCTHSPVVTCPDPSGGNVDLDTASLGQEEEGNAGTDLAIVRNRLAALASTELARYPHDSPPAGPADCQSGNVGWKGSQSSGFLGSDLSKGMILCVKTTEGRYGYLRIAEVGSYEDGALGRAKFTYQVWKKAGDT